MCPRDLWRVSATRDSVASSQRVEEVGEEEEEEEEDYGEEEE